jgi:hypothetical protein
VSEVDQMPNRARALARLLTLAAFAAAVAVGGSCFRDSGDELRESIEEYLSAADRFQTETRAAPSKPLLLEAMERYRQAAGKFYGRLVEIEKQSPRTSRDELSKELVAYNPRLQRASIQVSAVLQSLAERHPKDPEVLSALRRIRAVSDTPGAVAVPVTAAPAAAPAAEAGSPAPELSPRPAASPRAALLAALQDRIDRIRGLILEARLDEAEVLLVEVFWVPGTCPEARADRALVELFDRRRQILLDFIARKRGVCPGCPAERPPTDAAVRAPLAPGAGAVADGGRAAGAGAGGVDAAASKTGVPLCDRYLEAYLRCLDRVGRPAARKQMRETFAKTREGFLRSATTPEGRRGIEGACRMALDAARKTMASYHCTW